ncbi:uncharacterized protein [Arachis hypogaea]|uniref:uncharacterized protein isoform X2 n=1 Tax=Arachis hypogaea TaxID=3818 RepID=UPI000A2C3B30
MYRRLCALSRRCRQLELAAELLHHLQAVASPLISSLSLLNTIVVSSVTSDDELQWLIEIQKQIVDQTIKESDQCDKEKEKFSKEVS